MDQAQSELKERFALYESMSKALSPNAVAITAATPPKAKA